MKTKRDYDRAVKKSISAPQLLMDKAEDKARQLGFSAFSDYIQMLIRKDVLTQNSQHSQAV